LLSPPLFCRVTARPPPKPATVPPTENDVSAQATPMLVTLALAVPEALVSTQVWPTGCVSMVTAYALPLTSDVAKVKAPFAATSRLSPPLSSRNTDLPVPNPLTVPPMVTTVTPAPGVQVIWMVFDKSLPMDAWIVSMPTEPTGPASV
jgi:hypothetical protein